MNFHRGKNRGDDGGVGGGISDGCHFVWLISFEHKWNTMETVSIFRELWCAIRNGSCTTTKGNVCIQNTVQKHTRYRQRAIFVTSVILQVHDMCNARLVKSHNAQ